MESKTTCETHEGKKIMFYCLDPRCKNEPMCCIYCIKGDHSKCKDEFLLDKDDAKNRIKLVKNESDPTIITKKLNQLMELKLYEMNKTLLDKKKGFIASFDIQDSPDNILDPNVLGNVKKNFNFEFDQDTNLINITSKFDATEEQVMESLTHFEKDLEKKVLNFLDEFSKLNFRIKNTQMDAEDWIGHNYIDIEQNPEGVHFKRNANSTSSSHYCCLYQIPLDSPCLFKLHVEAVKDSERFIDFGIIKKEKFESCKSNFVCTFSSGGISFCGYTHCGGLTGKVVTTSCSSSDGYKNGSHMYMRYEPGVEIRYYDDDDKTDLKKSMTGDDNEYYLFVVVYHSEIAFTLERLE